MAAFEHIRAEEQNGTNVTGVKAALQLMGEDCGPTRPPSAWPLTDRQQAMLREFMGTWTLEDGSRRAAPRRHSDG